MFYLPRGIISLMALGVPEPWGYFLIGCLGTIIPK